MMRGAAAVTVATLVALGACTPDEGRRVNGPTVGAPRAEVAAPTSSISDGVLSISGDSDRDRFIVACSTANHVEVNGAYPDTGAAPCDEVAAIEVDARAGRDRLELPALGTEDFPAVTSLSIDAGDGDDIIEVDRLAADGNLIEGGDGLDRLVTTIPSGITISDHGLASLETAIPVATSIEELHIEGSDADETVDARSFSGSLRVLSQGGDDHVIGGSGPNSIDSGDGDDIVIGGPAADWIRTGEGTDEATGGGGADRFGGVEGSDRFQGGQGNDTFVLSSFYGGAGNTFLGGPGRDTVEVEVLRNPARLTDTLIRSAEGSARLRSIEFARLHGHEESGALYVDARGFSGDTYISGDYQDDVILGGSGRDELHGLPGDDELVGGPGRDLLDGEEGTDRCDGGPGRDRIKRCEQRR